MLEEIPYHKKNGFLYVFLSSERGRSLILTFPLKKYASFDLALEQCILFEVDGHKDFDAFSHLLPAQPGVKLSEAGYFVQERVYNSLVMLVMQLDEV
ncbi:hypothetical protein [Paenibacillus sp. YYML68]|uniref:hypothetical protein n=1 Tax=Paenibacillus sp. YYML68 TaxID=2909250 RepID=UPI0024914ED8|nr:hypothetical protein [Paenibacillus sp. YYML68]